MESSGRVRPRGTIARALVFGALVGIAATAVFAGVGGAGAGSARAADATAVTATAAQQDKDAKDAPFPDLAVTVSQTTDLISQGITVSWSGGKKSTPPSGTNGGENFLQIAQCWGEDPDNPGHPDRTTCQYGAFNSPGAQRDGFVTDDTVATQDEKYSIPRRGPFAPGYTSIPFTSVDGTVVTSIENGKQNGINVNVNEFFNPGQSNEVPWAGSASNGKGSVRFEVQTALQANGLGCGTPVKSGSTTAPQTCWLVIIPRGTGDSGESHITQSGLRWDAWKHNIAFKLTFKPLGISCNMGAAERQLRGSELVAGAVSSWQPVLCNSQGGAIYTMSNSAESDAAAAANNADSAPLALTSRALGGEQDELRYAPVAVGGLAISFAIDRAPSAGDGTPAEQTDKAGLTFDSLKLTPRLLAKLLTSSYLDALPTYADKKHLGANPRNLLLDPEFLDVNSDIPDWKFQAIVAPSVADLLVPQGRSDAAYQLWRYVLADPDAKAFLAGAADPWGMSVNPNSSTDAKRNPTGEALELPRDDFPKADPVIQPGVNGAAEINLVTWRPYTNDLDQSAYLTLRGDGQVLGAWDPQATPPKYGKSVRSLPGYQKVLGLTDTSSAAKYQVVTASLRNAAGQFVTPTTQSLTAAATAMTPVAGQSQVVEYDPAGSVAKSAAAAYPLAMPVYAATNPARGDAATRADYAAFIRYAATTGQTPGVEAGQLPPGYAPIPAAWKAQAIAAAAAIQSGASLDSPDDGGGNGSSAGNGTTGGFGGDGSSGVTAEPVSAPSTPQALGDAAGSLSGAKTAKDPDTGALAAVLPGGLLGGLAAAGAVPVIARLRRFP
ncbi:hypothetical protein [Leifsonia aquatica]|uniref:hypothetical protein n=1 Tax=Leifsonia aquatica TaxID=144185 RepID=UPI0013B45CD5|nr:hypothetical protein [Leifsonia aquatica]